MKAAIAIACLSLGASLISAGPGCGMCTEVGCATTIDSTVAVDGGFETLEGATARVCRMNQCVKADILVEAANASCDSSGNGEFWVSCSAEADGTMKFAIELLDQDADDEEDYVITVSDADGEEVGSSAGTVVYERTEINGDGCGYCYAGSF